MTLHVASDISRIGFIGTGLMGAPMVRRLLLSGFTVRVWNRSPEKLTPLREAGAEVASSAAQAPGLLVDFSTIGPVDTRDFAERLRARSGTAWVDAPVSGGATGAEQGRLVIFCGGEVADIARLGAAFAAFAQCYTQVGGLGAGQTLKLCNQLIVATNLAAITEALVLARASGLDLPTLPQALAGGFADSIPLQIFGTRMAAGVSLPVLGELSLMLKDLGAVAALAQAHHAHLPVSAAAMKVYEKAQQQGLSRRDLAALIELYPQAE